MMVDTGLYKYVYNDEIIYIGMSTNSIQDRIYNHSMEEKFQPYLKQSKIYVLPMENKVEIRSCESLLINKYKPMLNVVDTQSVGCSIDIEPSLGEWKPFVKKEPKQRKSTKGMKFGSYKTYEEPKEKLRYDDVDNLTLLTHVIKHNEWLYEQLDYVYRNGKRIKHKPNNSEYNRYEFDGQTYSLYAFHIYEYPIWGGFIYFKSPFDIEDIKKTYVQVNRDTCNKVLETIKEQKIVLDELKREGVIG